MHKIEAAIKNLRKSADQLEGYISDVNELAYNQARWDLMDVENRMKALGWSKRNLALEAGLEPSWVNRLFDGTRKPGKRGMDKIEKALQKAEVK